MKIYIEEHLYNISEAKTNMCIAEEDWGSVYVFAILQSSPRQTESQGKDKILSGGVTPFLTLYLTLPPERSGIHPKICLEETWECFIQFGAFRNYYSTYKIIISFLRIFNNSTVGAQKPKWISPRSQLAICSGLVSIQVSEEWGVSQTIQTLGRCSAESQWGHSGDHWHLLISM